MKTIKRIFALPLIALAWCTASHADGGLGMPFLLTHWELLKYAKNSCDKTEPASTSQNNRAIELFRSKNSELMQWYMPSKLALPDPAQNEQLLKSELAQSPIKCTEIPDRLNIVSQSLALEWPAFKEDVKSRKAWPGLWNDPFFKK